MCNYSSVGNYSYINNEFWNQQNKNKISWTPTWCSEIYNICPRPFLFLNRKLIINDTIDEVNQTLNTNLDRIIHLFWLHDWIKDWIWNVNKFNTVQHTATPFHWYDFAKWKGKIAQFYLLRCIHKSVTKFKSFSVDMNFWAYLIFSHPMILVQAMACSTLVQVMAWCHQAPSHYLIQYWPWSLLP